MAAHAVGDEEDRRVRQERVLVDVPHQPGRIAQLGRDEAQANQAAAELVKKTRGKS